MTTRTFVRPPANTQKWLPRAQPFSALATTSMLAALKNQKVPVSAVRATAWPSPVPPFAVCQAARTWKRPPSRQSVVASAAQLDAAAGGVGPPRARGQHLAALGPGAAPQLASHPPWLALPRQVVEVEQAQVAILAALHREVREAAAGDGRQHRRRRASQVGVLVLQLLEVGRRVAVDRPVGGVAGAPAAGPQLEHAVPPVVTALRHVEGAVAGRDEDAVQVGVVDHAAALP